MNKLIALLLLVTISSAGFLQEYSNFQTYQRTFGKNYRSRVIEAYRFALYLQNLKEIERLNREEEGTAAYGETIFTDMSTDEMKTRLGVTAPLNYEPKYVKNFTNDDHYKPREDIPEIWNWAQQGAVGSIKDQGSCGSCWSFGTAGNIEGLNFIRTKKMVEMSEQQLIDCDKTNFGCSGGWPYKALDWIAHNGGLESYKDYPLRTNYSGPCEFKESKSAIKIKGYMNVTHDQKIIKDVLYQTGPLAILLDFTGLFHYKAGVANPRFCYDWPDHALVLVGYGVEKEDYWLIKNSWGPAWGINGYFMLKRGANKCGINLWATSAVLE